MSVAYVYVITHKKSKAFYIGSTSNLDKRLRQHKSKLRNGNHVNGNLQAIYDVTKAGIKGFSVSVDEASSLEEARFIEAALIDDHIGNGLCLNMKNSACGGDKVSSHPNNAAIRRKIQAASIRMWAEMSEEQYARRCAFVSGSGNGMFGRSHSKKAKELISKKAKEYYKTHANPFLGKKHTPEMRAHLSKKAIERNMVGDRNPFYGKTHTEEVRERISKANANRDPSWKDGIVKAVSVDGVVYDSLADAHRALDIPVVTIRFRALSSNPKFASYFMMESGPVAAVERTNPAAKAVVADGVLYASTSKAARALGKSSTSIQFRCRSNAPQWNEFYYADSPKTQTAETKKVRSPAKKVLTLDDIDSPVTPKKLSKEAQREIRKVLDRIDARKLSKLKAKRLSKAS